MPPGGKKSFADIVRASVAATQPSDKTNKAVKVDQTVKDINPETKEVVAVWKYQIIKPTIAAATAKKQPTVLRMLLKYSSEISDEDRVLPVFIVRKLRKVITEVAPNRDIRLMVAHWVGKKMMAYCLNLKNMIAISK